MLVLDGAMGTELQKRGHANGCFEGLNMSDPELIKSIHRSYAQAGADVIETNTFGASALKLWDYDLRHKVKEINEAGVRIAREAAPNCFIAGVIGPLGDLIHPLGQLTFDKAYEAFKEQASSLKDADFIVIQTFFDIKELRAALIAVKEVFSGPIVTSMTFSQGRTTTGTDVETYVTVAESLGANVIGTNCSDGPEGMYKTIMKLAKFSSKPIWAEPNAGIPKIIDGKTIWSYPPKRFGEYAKKFVRLGSSIVGGCCGTDTSFVNATVHAVRGMKPLARHLKKQTKVSSRTRTITIKPTLIVGERINPTNKKEFQQELKSGKMDYVRMQAQEQTSQGAHLLDINVGVPALDEINTLTKALETVQGTTDLPLVIDTSDKKALESALRTTNGKPIINSVNGKTLDILPLAKKYGAAIIVLCLDERGIPKTKEQRINIGMKIINSAIDIGIPKEDIIVDPLVLTLATNPENEKIILESVKEFKAKGYKTILGISNISHGLPNRASINAQFFQKASTSGLDLAIINPDDTKFVGNIEIKSEFEQKELDKNAPVEKQLYQSIIQGNKDSILEIINDCLTTMSALQVNNIMVDALSEVGRRFNCKEYFLPQVLASAEATKIAFSRLKKELIKAGGESRGKIMFATVENDVHDIGKNIVIALLESNNYQVIDLGTSVPSKKIVEEVVKGKPDIIALSALMTTTVIEMEKVIKELRQKGIDVPVIVGGAVVDKDYAGQIKAEYSKDALSAVKKINDIIQWSRQKKSLTS
ncbi:MAG: homocysteine S-methyltransferase family protein [Nanoarchaeota archaeon]|nr:homocysteine S-methyltransferase family protein [Nanoarchaeota archaeon]